MMYLRYFAFRILDLLSGLFNLFLAPMAVQFISRSMPCCRGVRLSLPFDVRFGIRWSGSSTAKAILQTGIGFKGNGRFAPTFRIQSDDSSAAGYNSPNPGQARGWEYGGH